MKKRHWISLISMMLILAGCATKSYVRLEDERLTKFTSQADSTIIEQLKADKNQQLFYQDSLYAKLTQDTDSLFISMMAEIYRKNIRIDSLQQELQLQSVFIDSLIADVDTLERLQTRFKDADYTIFDFSRLKSNLDSLMINQKHLSRELQYMIRDLNLIERNLMDIMNYSINSLKAQLQASTVMTKRSLYKNSATAYKMVMVYLMTNVSSDPEKLLNYIDSVYAMGDALDTVKVQFAAPGGRDPSPEDTLSRK